MGSEKSNILQLAKNMSSYMKEDTSPWSGLYPDIESIGATQGICPVDIEQDDITRAARLGR